jgi:hypothetical protein
MRSGPKPGQGVNFQPFEAWIKASKVESLASTRTCSATVR